MPHAELAQIVLDESGYTAMWQNDKSPEAPGRLENLKELIHAMEEFESLGGFLEHVSLVMENAAASDGEMVTIMTLHGAKGLEFDIVFLPGWEEGLFPTQRSLDENGVKGLEEERRLAYVGMTRARKRALISFAANRRVHNMWQNALPSRFIAELPKAHIERDEEHLWRPSERYMGPQSGWGRQPLREGFGRRGGTLIDLSAEAVAQTGTGRYPSGARIFHQKFGYGKVLHSRRRQAGDRVRQGRREKGDGQLRHAGGAGGMTSLARTSSLSSWSCLARPSTSLRRGEIDAACITDSWILVPSPRMTIGGSR